MKLINAPNQSYQDDQSCTHAPSSTSPHSRSDKMNPIYIYIQTQ